MNDTLLLIGAFVILPLLFMIAAAFGTGSINLLRQCAQPKKSALERAVLFVSGVIGVFVVVGFCAMPIVTHGARGAVALLIASGIWWFLIRPRRARHDEKEKKA